MTENVQDIPYGGTPDRVPSFGRGFNYSVWTGETTISLHNVPWNNDYRDIVKFRNRGALDKYLSDSGGVKITNSRYARVNEPIRIQVPFNVAYQYNYLRVENPAQPIDNNDVPRTFYYFITDVQYLSPETTEIQIQLDIWQTFSWYAEFGNCYVERGHIGIANFKQFDDHGRTYLTIPEGFDIGSEYYVDDTYSHELADNGFDIHSGGTGYHVLVWSTTKLLADNYGSATNPNIDTAVGSTFEYLPNGTELTWFTSPHDFQRALIALSEYPWITQGITMVMAVPRIDVPESEYEEVVKDIYSGQTLKGTIKARKIFSPKLKNKILNLKTNWRENVKLGQRYRYLYKFLTYPYCAVELTTYSGTPIVLKPEHMWGEDLKVVQMGHYALPNPRVMFYPLRYNAAPNVKFDQTYESYVVAGHHDFAEFLDLATGITNFPTFSVVNDGHLLYMAANAHSIAYQHRSADWSQQRALTANQLGYNQASEAMRLQSQLTDLGIGAANQTMNLQNQTHLYRGATDVVGRGLGGLLGGGGVLGAAIGIGTGIADTAINMNQTTQQTGINNALAASQNASRVSNAGYMRDTNRDYADFAARGDYANQIGAINAKVQDATLIQPTTSGQVGGEAFTLVTANWSVNAKVKRISPSAIQAIGEYWLRYGYAINRFAKMPPSFMVMSKFTYWKLRETYIRASAMPESFKQTLRGIFEKGVTVWTNPDDIGNIDVADNAPLQGISL